MCSLLNIYIYIWIIMIQYFVIRNFSGTCSYVEILKGYKVRERLGAPALEGDCCGERHLQKRTPTFLHRQHNKGGKLRSSMMPSKWHNHTPMWCMIWAKGNVNATYGNISSVTLSCMTLQAALNDAQMSMHTNRNIAKPILEFAYALVDRT